MGLEFREIGREMGRTNLVLLLCLIRLRRQAYLASLARYSRSIAARYLALLTSLLVFLDLYLSSIHTWAHASFLFVGTVAEQDLSC